MARSCAGQSDAERVTRFLANSRTYGAAPVAIRETRSSLVFLTPELVFKLKKPIADEFVDLRTVEARRRNALDEVLLNRRLAAGIYLDPVAVTAGDDGRPTLGGDGPSLDWLVVMRRIPDAAFLDRMIDEGTMTRPLARSLGRRLARFYRALPPCRPHAEAVLGDFEGGLRTATRRLRDGRFALDRVALDRLTGTLARRFAETRGEIADRVGRGLWREGHGDLRPEHVCFVPAPLAIDCLEFSARLRTLDPFDEVAYLGLECERLGAAWIGPILWACLADGFADPPSAPLAGFYRGFRALHRAYFALRHLLDPHPRSPESWRPLASRYLAIAASSVG